MQHVITVEQAKKITGGRTPLVPVEYEQAITALEACITLDEAKYWNNKADALAAWAKIYRSKDAETKAKRLKLHAYRRMSQLAEELRPGGYSARGDGRGATGVPGPNSLLRDYGISQGTRKLIRNIGAIPKSQFDAMVNSQKPPGVVRAAIAGVGLSPGRRGRTGSDAMRKLFGNLAGYVNVGVFRNQFCRKYDAKDLGSQIDPKEADRARAYVREVIEWLDELEQALPKAK